MDRSKKRRTGCSVCLQYFMIVVNILYFLLGAGLIAIFVYLEVTQVYFVSSVLGTDLVTVADALLIAGGGLLVITSVVGIAAGCTRLPSTTVAHFSLMAVVILSLLAGVVCALVFKMWLTDPVRQDMEDTLKTEYGIYVNISSHHRKITEDWDTAQTKWECCSVDDQSWSIYQESEWYRRQPGTPGDGPNPKPYVPASCCVVDDNGNYVDLKKCQTTSDGPPNREQGGQFSGQINSALHYRGCYQSAHDYLLYDDISWFGLVVGIGSVAAILVLFGLFVSVIFYVIRKQEMKFDLIVMDDMQGQTTHSLTQSPLY